VPLLAEPPSPLLPPSEPLPPDPDPLVSPLSPLGTGSLMTIDSLSISPPPPGPPPPLVKPSSLPGPPEPPPPSELLPLSPEPLPELEPLLSSLPLRLPWRSPEPELPPDPASELGPGSSTDSLPEWLGPLEREP
jgi:histone-lysine N-methyltransferase SETD1